MKPLLLSGYGVKLKLDYTKSRSQLTVIDGNEFDKRGKTYTFRPRRIPYDSIFIEGQSGYISLKALHWLSKNKIPVFVLDFNGSLLSSILPPMPVKANLRTNQLKAYENTEKKFKIAYELVRAKVQRTKDILNWLSKRHDIENQIQKIKRESLSLHNTRNIVKLKSIEGRIALLYWQTLQSIIPETYEFEGRMTKSHRQNRATDPVNVSLNYTYGILECVCRKAVNMVGLEPSIGFLHDYATYQTKHSLVYDLQEPFRFLAELTVLKAIRSKQLDINDFYFTGDNYTYKFNPESKHKLMNLVCDKFNSNVHYTHKRYKWDTIILKKTQELTQFLSNKSKDLDFSEPKPNIYYM